MLTGEPDAGDPHVRFGGRGGAIQCVVPTPIYVIAYAGTKSYGEGQASHTEVNFDSVSTYQVIDIQVSSDRLLYRAYDIDGNLKDELVIEK